MAKARGELKTVKIDQVFPNDYNHNEMSKEMVEKEAEAFRRFGVLRSVLVRQTGPGRYVIIDGEHRYKILKESGEKEITIRNLGKITDEEAKTLTIALDEIKGQKDFIKAAELFAGIKTYSLDEIATFLPYKTDELKTMVEAVDFDFSEYGPLTDPFVDDMVSEYGTILCRVPKDEAGDLDAAASTLATRLGISDKKEPVQLGRVFTHLLKEVTANA